jgi:hypothetical protein
LYLIRSINNINKDCLIIWLLVCRIDRLMVVCGMSTVPSPFCALAIHKSSPFKLQLFVLLFVPL